MKPANVIKYASEMAYQWGCDDALVGAIAACKDLKDLKTTAEQATGPGSIPWSTWICNVLRSSEWVGWTEEVER